MEDFKSEQCDRAAAHGKIADHQKKYDHDIGELKAKLAQTEEDLLHYQDRLADVEQLYERKEKEMTSVLKEAAKNQEEVQAKTSQVKQYKKQVDTLKTQVLICVHVNIVYIGIFLYISDPKGFSVVFVLNLEDEYM